MGRPEQEENGFLKDFRVVRDRLLSTPHISVGLGCITKYRRLGGLNNGNLFSSFQRPEVQDQGASRLGFL
jgi:hypothetical protein